MSDKDNPYTPISCTEHSNYELFIMHRQRLHIAWKDPHNHHNIDTLLPIDLQTKDGEEFLVAQDRNGQEIRIRLDYITHCTPINK